MDRVTVYPGAIPLETDILNTNRNTLTAIAMLCQDIFGTATVFTCLPCVPTIPASLTVNVNPGRVYSLQNRDTTAYSSLPADTVNQIMKQGILLTAQSFALTPPASAGFSVNFLISAAFVEQDVNPVVLPYYNAANPQQAFSGPPINGVSSGTAQNTTRQDTVQLTLTPGIAATTGTQATPAAPVGTIPLWVVTVANGQTTITAANIAEAPQAPLLTSSLMQAIQADVLNYAVDVGTVNVLQANYVLPITGLTDNMNLWVKPKFTNTGSCTFTPNPGVIAPAAVVGGNHAALQGNEFLAGGRSNLVYRLDINSWVLVESTGGAVQVAPATQSQHAVQLAQLTAHGDQLSSVNIVTATAQSALINGIELINTAGIERVLPPSSSAGVGGRAKFAAFSAGAFVAPSGTDSIVSITGASLGTTLIFAVGDTAEFVTNGSGTWYLIGGSLALKYAGNMLSVLSTNGYQKLPGGLILQWGTSTTTASGANTPTFPIAFPNGQIGAVLTPQITAVSSSSGLGWQSVSKSTMNVFGSAAQIYNYSYLVWGS